MYYRVYSNDRHRKIQSELTQEQPAPKQKDEYANVWTPNRGEKNKLEKGKIPPKDKQYKNKNKITQQQPTPPPPKQK